MTSYEVRIKYAYRINGSDFESSRISVSNRYHGDKEWARDMIARIYPLGAPVAVYYDPADPARAVLIPGKLEPGSHFYPWVMLAMAAVCAVGMVLI